MIATAMNPATHGTGLLTPLRLLLSGRQAPDVRWLLDQLQEDGIDIEPSVDSWEPTNPPEGVLLDEPELTSAGVLSIVQRLTERLPVAAVAFVVNNIPLTLTLQTQRGSRIRFLDRSSPSPAILTEIRQGLEESRRRAEQSQQVEVISQRLARLTVKEQQTLELLRQGLPNKAISHRLSICERAVEMRRSSLMKKLHAHSLAELIRQVTQHELLADALV